MSTLANQTRSDNWTLFRLRGAIAATRELANRAHTQARVRALREAESALTRVLHFEEAERLLQRRYESYRDSLWRRGDHADCPIPKVAGARIHSTMRLGDAWAQIVRVHDGYQRLFSFPTTAAPETYRRAKEAQRTAAHRLLREDTRDPRKVPFPGDRWTGDPDARHLIVELLHPVHVERYLDDPNPEVAWLVRYFQAPHTGSKVPGLPNEIVEVPFGPTWPFNTFAGATQGTTRHVLVDAQTLPREPAC